MVGTKKEARIVAEWNFEEWDEYEYVPPKGFEYIGEGASRVALRSLATGIVYKRHYWPESTENALEHKNIQRIKQIPIKGWRVPETSLYHIGNEAVIAMEFITGGMDIHCQRSYASWDRPCNCSKPLGCCSAEAWEQLRERWGITDVHVGNIVIDDEGTRVLIDVVD